MASGSSLGRRRGKGSLGVGAYPADPGRGQSSDALGRPFCTQLSSRSRAGAEAAVGGRVDGHKGEHRGQESAEKWECSGQAGSHGEEKGQ